MNIVMIHGQNHKGSTYHIGRMLADKLGGKVMEFFLPADFDRFCVGCTTCFMKSETLCPHYDRLKPITEAIDQADVLILTSPVYVYHATGPMKSFLDHYGYRWLVHRPEESMFSKQAVCISTAAGGGMKSTCRDMADSMFYWGIAKIYQYGIAVRAVSWEGVNDRMRQKLEKKTTALAGSIRKRDGRVRPGLKTKGFFLIMRKVHRSRFAFNEADNKYWKEKGWTGKTRPWRL